MEKLSEEQYNTVLAELTRQKETLQCRLAREELADLRKKYGKESSVIVYGEDEVKDAVWLFENAKIIMIDGESYDFEDIIEYETNKNEINVCIAYPDVQIKAKNNAQKGKILSILDKIVKKNEEN